MHNLVIPIITAVAKSLPEIFGLTYTGTAIIKAQATSKSS